MITIPEVPTQLAKESVPGERQPTDLEAKAAGPPALIDVTGMRWETLSQLLVWGWEYLGYEVEITDIRSRGVVDFILTDGAGYTYVQARRWQQPEVTSNDIARLRADMTLTGVQAGIWMTSGAFTQETATFRGEVRDQAHRRGGTSRHGRPDSRAHRAYVALSLPRPLPTRC
jgi:hypothetical protein